MSTRPEIDRRAEETRQRIGAAFLRLGGMKALSSIGVGQLAREAGIARSTFYAHYRGLDDYLARGFADMLTALAGRGDDDRLLPVAAVLDHILAAGPAAQELARSRHFPRMLVEGERALRRFVEHRLERRLPHQNSADRKTAALLLSAGFLALLRDWMSDARGRPIQMLDQRVGGMEGLLVPA